MGAFADLCRAGLRCHNQIQVRATSLTIARSSRISRRLLARPCGFRAGTRCSTIYCCQMLCPKTARKVPDVEKVVGVASVRFQAPPPALKRSDRALTIPEEFGKLTKSVPSARKSSMMSTEDMLLHKAKQEVSVLARAPWPTVAFTATPNPEQLFVCRLRIALFLAFLVCTLSTANPEPVEDLQ